MTFQTNAGSCNEGRNFCRDPTKRRKIQRRRIGVNQFAVMPIPSEILHIELRFKNNNKYKNANY